MTKKPDLLFKNKSMVQKNISVKGQDFPFPDEATVDEAKAAIRSAFLLAGGFLSDQNGALLDGNVLLGSTIGKIVFVEGQSVHQGYFVGIPFHFISITSP